MDARKVVGRMPRGLTRYFILHLLKEKPMTGKEIMVEAERRSEGLWKPSPGLVYPLLGKLLSDGLVEEAEAGGYRITEKGIKALDEYSLVQEELETQFQVIAKLGLVGRILASEFLDRAFGFVSTFGRNVEELGEKAILRYKAFLESELRRIEEKAKSRKHS